MTKSGERCDFYGFHRVALVACDELKKYTPDSGLARMKRRPDDESTLRQPALKRHLTAFETNLVKATGARLLPLMATTSGLAKTGTDTTTNAAFRMLRALSGLNRIQFHINPRT